MSYVIFFSIVSDRWSIRINLRAACTSCVVMWIGQELSVVKGDYLFVALDEFGYPEVGFDLGGGAVRLKYDLLNVTDGSPHTIELQRYVVSGYKHDIQHRATTAAQRPIIHSGPSVNHIAY